MSDLAEYNSEKHSIKNEPSRSGDGLNAARQYSLSDLREAFRGAISDVAEDVLGALQLDDKDVCKPFKPVKPLQEGPYVDFPDKPTGKPHHGLK